MYTIPVDTGINLIPNITSSEQNAALIEEIERLLEGKMINGQRRNHRYGSKVFGHFGPFEREPLPPLFQSLIESIQFKHAGSLDFNGVFNQVEVLKLSSGTKYFFDVEKEQHTIGSQLFVSLSGQFPITLFHNTVGHTISTEVTDAEYQPTPGHLDANVTSDGVLRFTAQTPSVIVSPPENSLISFPESMTTSYTKQIKAQSYRCKALKSAASPADQSGSPILLPNTLYDTTVLEKSMKLKNDEKKAKKLEYLRKRLDEGKIDQIEFQKQLEQDNISVNNSEDAPQTNEPCFDAPIDPATQQYLMSLPTYPYKRCAVSYALIFRQFTKHVPLSQELVVNSDLAISQPQDRQMKEYFEKQQRQNKIVPTIAVDLEQMTDEQLSIFEKQHVHAVYDNIADHFSGTRYQAWPQVDEYIQHLPPYTLMADIGCGNGKYLSTNPSILATGCDISINLLKLAHERGCEVAHGDGLAVPLKNEFFDTTISIAVLHHIASKKRRVECINELLRITRVGGQVLITVWAKEQDGSGGRVFTQGDVWVPFKTTNNVQQELTKQKELRQKEREDHIKTHRKAIVGGDAHNAIDESATLVHLTDEEKAKLDIPIPEDINTDSTRFYHVFAQGELEDHVNDTAINYKVNIDKVFYGKGNWCIIFTRLE